jgi:hypothetical protein
VAVVAENAASTRALQPQLLREESPTPEDGYGRFHEIWSAPTLEQRRALARRVAIRLPAEIATMDADLEISWEGDVLQLVVDGVVVYDQFWTGHDFVVNLADVGATPASEVVLELMPLHPLAPVRVSDPAQAARDRSDAPIGAVHAIRLTEHARWHERAGS